MPDLNQPVEVVVLYPGPSFEVAPFPLIRVAKEDVPAYLEALRGRPEVAGDAVGAEAAGIGLLAHLARGDRVEIRGFGAFSVKKRDARVGRNPRTGEHVPVAEKAVPMFKAGKEMRLRLNRTAAPSAPAPGEPVDPVPRFDL